MERRTATHKDGAFPCAAPVFPVVKILERSSERSTEIEEPLPRLKRQFHFDPNRFSTAPRPIAPPYAPAIPGRNATNDS